MAKNRADMLKALQAPKNAMADQEADTDLELLGQDQDQDQAPVGGASEMLADLSDDDLVAEMKKRGLLAPDEHEQPAAGGVVS